MTIQDSRLSSNKTELIVKEAIKKKLLLHKLQYLMKKKKKFKVED